MLTTAEICSVGTQQMFSRCGQGKLKQDNGDSENLLSHRLGSNAYHWCFQATSYHHHTCKQCTVLADSSVKFQLVLLYETDGVMTYVSMRNMTALTN